jgi:hypothetical protein
MKIPRRLPGGEISIFPTLRTFFAVLCPRGRLSLRFSRAKSYSG